MGFEGMCLELKLGPVLRCVQVRLGNAKVQENILDVNGATEFLQDCGFEFRFEDTGSSGAIEG